MENTQDTEKKVVSRVGVEQGYTFSVNTLTGMNYLTLDEHQALNLYATLMASFEPERHAEMFRYSAWDAATKTWK